MNGFTIFLLVAAIVMLAATVHGLVRPRMGHNVSQHAVDTGDHTGTTRLIRETNIHQHGIFGSGCGSS